MLYQYRRTFILPGFCDGVISAERALCGQGTGVMPRDVIA